MAEQASRASQPVCCRQHRAQPVFSSIAKLAIETWVLGGVVEEQGRRARPTSPASVTIVDSWKPVFLLPRSVSRGGSGRTPVLRAPRVNKRWGSHPYHCHLNASSGISACISTHGLHSWKHHRCGVAVQERLPRTKTEPGEAGSAAVQQRVSWFRIAILGRHVS